MQLNIPQVDLDKSEGVWIEYIPEVKFKIRRFFSRGCDKVKQRLLKDVREGTSNSVEVSPEHTKNYIIQVYAEGVIVDWDGLVNLETGEPIPYDPKTAYEILADDENVDLFNFIAKESEARDNFAKEIKDENVKKQKNS